MFKEFVTGSKVRKEPEIDHCPVNDELAEYSKPVK